MRGTSINANWVPLVLLFIASFTLSLLPSALSANGDGYSQAVVTNLLYSRMKNLSKILAPDVEQNLAYCVKDLDADWNKAFEFENLDFLSKCVQTSKGDVTKRLCSAAEIRFYFEEFSGDEYVKPNINCNLSSWVNGCEPGWGCTLDDNDDDQNDENKKAMPLRTSECEPCCEGFFCPPGITCMIPCPLGSYCPLATLNKTTGMCEPYTYQIPPRNKKHSCGGADMWTDASTSSSIFCSPGSYCPTNTQKLSCSSGHFCRMGSTAQQSCFKLAQCGPNTAYQRLHIYGFLIILASDSFSIYFSWSSNMLNEGSLGNGLRAIAGLGIVLILIHNCSDQVLHTREKRQANSRERAARFARESVHARDRWKFAKDLATKPTDGLQQQLSRTYSRKKSTKSEPKGFRFGVSKSSSKDTAGKSKASAQSSEDSKGKKKDSGNLTNMMHALEDDPESHPGFNLEIGDKNLKKNMPKSKQLHTRSQVFQYAYGQIEKEKAMQEQNKDLTFSGIISMGGDSDVRSRPVIEIAFKDLTLTLKHKNKHLLRCVTGKFVPGRVSAVMGPSGAGKTTFLSALAGKATGCTRSGLILINGNDESIHSYKKIVGFVPQDDIVHGDLTVEENLRFSARCRLPATMSKPDKVLVIERVIDCLGLQAIRDSLVGTVSRRGISGGQKKRVNVGLEMVMEPSLLILDEPTSGLDSSSSMLLLRALRREALEGVNICMVLHQPSYSLFKMFDDIVLLAKGGLVAYHGSVKKVEEYFSGIGIHVPDRINPPDHFIDVLEGMVELKKDVTVEQLPVRWMLHNGYSVPPDMLHYMDGIGSSQPKKPAYTKQQSLAGELWQDVKLNVEIKKDHFEHRFGKSDDLSDRVTAGPLKQYRYFLGRVGKQRLRDARLQVADYLILLLAGGCLGFLAKVDDESFGAQGYTFTVIAVSLLCKIAALRSFALDKLHYWRESASGMSSLAYFLSKDTIDHFNTVVKPLVYLSMFYFFNSPRSSFVDNYIVLLCLVYCVTGMGYALAIWLEPGPAQLWSVIVPVVLTLVANQDKDSEVVKRFGKFCYTKWAMEGFIISNAQRYDGVWLISRCNFLKLYGYDLHEKKLCLVILILYGVIGRCFAYFCLLTFQKK